tara:strand:+ start:63 stop:287 length:225 start_codon:yes stop_codon:yes gene_type:complete
LFQIYGIIKILIKTSSNKIIGIISIAGKTKEKLDTHMAEKPKPLKPLTIEATKTTINKKMHVDKFTSNNDSKLI